MRILAIITCAENSKMVMIGTKIIGIFQFWQWAIRGLNISAFFTNQVSVMMRA